MECYTVLDQVIDLLRRGQVTYGALKLQCSFSLRLLTATWDGPGRWSRSFATFLHSALVQTITAGVARLGG